MALTKGYIRNAATTPLDVRLMDQARLVQNADGSTRTGVLGALPTLVTATATTTPMTVNVAAAPLVASRAVGDGAVVYSNDGVVAVTIPAAPGANSRIDVIWTRHQDDTAGDAAGLYLPIFGVTSGAAAASPTEPAIPTGAVKLATLRIYAGTTATNGGANVLTQAYQMTAAQGGVVPFRTLVDLKAWTTAADTQLAAILGKHGVWQWDLAAATWRPQFPIVGEYNYQVPVLNNGAATALASAPTLAAGLSSDVVAEVLTPKVGGWTVLKEGLYRMEARVTSAVGGSAQSINHRAFADIVAGGRALRLNIFGAPAEDKVSTASLQIRLSANAAIDVTDYQLSGGARTWNVAFTLTYLGPLT